MNALKCSFGLILGTYSGQKALHSRRNPQKVRRDCIHNHLKILLFFQSAKYGLDDSDLFDLCIIGLHSCACPFFWLFAIFLQFYRKNHGTEVFWFRTLLLKGGGAFDCRKELSSIRVLDSSWIRKKFPIYSWLWKAHIKVDTMSRIVIDKDFLISSREFKIGVGQFDDEIRVLAETN